MRYLYDEILFPDTCRLLEVNEDVWSWEFIDEDGNYCIMHVWKNESTKSLK